MQTKNYSALFKAHKGDDGKPTGEVTAVVSVFGNVDIVGDRVLKGAFRKTLEEWKASGDPIPMLWSHDWSNPMSHIGGWDASKAVETDEGLELTGLVDIDAGNPIADQAFRLMEKRLVREFSFAYDVLDEAPAKDGANELIELSLIEAGPTLKGANSATRLVAAKAMLDAADAKAGRVLSAKNEGSLRDVQSALKAAAEVLDGVLAAVEPEKSVEADGEKDAAVAEADAEVVDEQIDELDQEPDGTSEVDEDTTEQVTAEQAIESLDVVRQFLTDTGVELTLGTDDGDHV